MGTQIIFDKYLLRIMNIVYENTVQICCLFVRYYSQIFIRMKTMIGIDFILYKEFYTHGPMASTRNLSSFKILRA